MLARQHIKPRPSSPDAHRRRQPSRPPLLHPPPPPPAAADADADAEAEAGNDGNVDRVLFRNLVEMVPLVESLMDRRAQSSFTRRATMVYTPTPPQSRKATGSKGGRTAHTVSAKKRRDLDNAETNNQNGSDGFSIFSSSAEAENVLKEREELNTLREQINVLQRKILEKDEALKTAEGEINQMKASCVSIDELRLQVAEKDSLVKSINSQLNNAKIALADKQATLERLTWESQTSNRRIEELQGEIVSMDYEITALMQIYEKLCGNNSVVCPGRSSISYDLEPLPVVNDMDDFETAELEEARATYLAAVAAAKCNPTEESLAIAAEARLRLHAFVI